MAHIDNVLIIGGGFSGMSAAIELRKRGVAVDLVEIDPGWRNYGAGITLSSSTLRALKDLGVLPEVIERGFCADEIVVCDGEGRQVAVIAMEKVAGPEWPAGGGIMRPVLADILAKATRASGTDVMLGTTFSAIREDADGVEVELTNGKTRRYDLVVGADGLFSKVRTTLFPDAPRPQPSGQGVWRAVLPRRVDRPTLYHGPNSKIGLNPVSRDEMYIFVNETRGTEYIPEDQLPALLRATLEGFGGLIAELEPTIGPDSRIVYRPLEGLLMPLPWSTGRVLLIGDAVHSTTPHLASGAGIGIEDAIVLADEVGRGGGVAEVLARHAQRRWERCRMVVESSRRLGEIEQGHGSKDEHTALMREAQRVLAQPL